MKVLIYHQSFDRDVSSGTSHAAHQWHETFMAFGVTEVAVINETEIPYHRVNDSVTIHEFKTFNEFLEKHGSEQIFYVEVGGKNVKEFDFTINNGEYWLLFGSSRGFDKADIGIDTNGVALYPRECASIVLAEAKWQLR